MSDFYSGHVHGRSCSDHSRIIHVSASTRGVRPSHFHRHRSNADIAERYVRLANCSRPNAESWSSTVPAIAKARFAASELLHLYLTSAETAECQGKMTFPVNGHVLFEDVSFSYPSRRAVPVLKNVSFEIKPGECVGIVGYATLHTRTRHTLI